MVSAILGTMEREGQIVRMDERKNSQISEESQREYERDCCKGQAGEGEKEWIFIN